MKKLNILIGLLIGLLMISGLALASSDIKGMGDGPGPAATGDNGIEWNPAAMSPDHVFVMDTSWLEFAFWSDSWSALDILEYTGFVEGVDNHWSREDVEAILANIPNGGLSSYSDLSSRTKMIIGPVGLSLGVNAHARGTIDKDIFNILFKGNKEYVDLTGTQLAAKLIDLTDTQADLLTTADAGFTLSLPVKKYFKRYLGFFDDLYAGSTIHVVTGGYGNIGLTDDTAFYISYGEPDENGIQIPTIRFADGKEMTQKPDGTYPLMRAVYTVNSDDPVDLSYLGNGMAVDLGLYAKKNNFRYGLSFMNMGSMKFDNYEIMEFGVVKSTDPTIANADPTYTFTEEPIIRRGTSSLKVPLPFRFNLGASYKKGHWFYTGAHISAVRTVSVNIDNNDQMITDGHMYLEYGAGMELNPIWILPLRIGVVGSKNNVAMTTGLGLHLGPIQTDLAMVTGFKKFGLNLNTSLEF